MHNERPAKLDYWFGNGLTSLYFNIHTRAMCMTGKRMIMHVTGHYQRGIAQHSIGCGRRRSNSISQPADLGRHINRNVRVRTLLCILFTPSTYNISLSLDEEDDACPPL